MPTVSRNTPLATMLIELDACTRAAERAGVPRVDLCEIEQRGRIAAWKAAQAGKQFADRRRLRAWFGSVGRRLARNYYRTQRRLPECRDTAELEYDAEKVESAEQLAVAQTARALLDEALLELAKQRPELWTIVDAHDLQERPMTEIAAELGLCLNTAWNRRRLGWEFLRAYLARERTRTGGRS